MLNLNTLTLNPIKRRRERKLAEKQDQARKGKTTSGYLSPGERARFFRGRRKG